MTLVRRVIACLDVDDGRVVKGVRFESLRDVGDPADLAARYEADGADEIVFLDVTASVDGRATLLAAVERTAQRLFVPLAVGGGIRSVEDAALVLRAGADKVAVNSAAVANPSLISELAARFGSQSVVVSIDAARRERGWEVYVRGGRDATGLDAIEWAACCAELGAGELLVTSIDRDGTREGYDVALVDRIAESVTVPVIASGGAGSAGDIVDVFTRSAVDAALLAGMLHDGSTTISAIKTDLDRSGIRVRAAA